ncbi:hypothetical protein N9917_00470 [Deltaproteobacteria bacterium]|nr:hypothetical protein [Deltaproteobacteria bacterium]
MPTPRELVDAMDKHPDFKLGVLKLLIAEAQIANVWEWGVPEKGKLECSYRRLTVWGNPLAIVYFVHRSEEWCWRIFDPWREGRRERAAVMAVGKAENALRCRKAADQWLRRHDWTVPGTHMVTE